MADEKEKTETDNDFFKEAIEPKQDASSTIPVIPLNDIRKTAPRTYKSPLFFLIGGIIGVLIVRGFFFDNMEEIAWRLFWSGLSKGKTYSLIRLIPSLVSLTIF